MNFMDIRHASRDWRLYEHGPENIEGTTHKPPPPPLPETKGEFLRTVYRIFQSRNRGSVGKIELGMSMLENVQVRFEFVWPFGVLKISLFPPVAEQTTLLALAPTL